MGSSFYRSIAYPFFIAVVSIQGVHVFEHIVQLAQIYIFGVPNDKAFGLLGYVIQFDGTEEWLHLVFNVTYLTSLYLLLIPLRRVVPEIVPRRVFLVFVISGVGLESWHMVEHVVIISHVIANHGCPCPGIGDAALGVSDKVLHFFYNIVSYSATVVPFSFVLRHRPRFKRAVSVPA
jgi:hypothetical protein